MMNGRAEIDTRPPFSSVKEVVSLFTPHLQEFAKDSKSERSVAELKDTKHNLEKESKSMANEMYSLREELEKTRRELKELKELQESKRQFTKMMADLQDMEDLKYVKMSEEELQKKRYVTFARPTPSKVVLERHLPLKKKKKAFTIPLIGAIFPKRKTKSIHK